MDRMFTMDGAWRVEIDKIPTGQSIESGKRTVAIENRDLTWKREDSIIEIDEITHGSEYRIWIEHHDEIREVYFAMMRTESSWETAARFVDAYRKRFDEWYEERSEPEARSSPLNN